MSTQGEERIISENPLRIALRNLSNRDKRVVLSAIDSAEEILTNRFPQGNQNAYVTGLEGHYPPYVEIGKNGHLN